MDLEIFKNCSGFTDEELAADICCSALSVMLVALVILMKFYTHRVCGTIFKHLTIGLLPFTALWEFTFALQLKYFYDPQDLRFCEAIAFIQQFLVSIHLLFAVRISLIWFVKKY